MSCQCAELEAQLASEIAERRKRGEENARLRRRIRELEAERERLAQLLQEGWIPSLCR